MSDIQTEIAKKLQIWKKGVKWGPSGCLEGESMELAADIIKMMIKQTPEIITPKEKPLDPRISPWFDARVIQINHDADTNELLEFKLENSKGKEFWVTADLKIDDRRLAKTVLKVEEVKA